MTPGARYRAKSSGSVYEVERIGTSLSDPCVLRCVEISPEHMSELHAWAQTEVRGMIDGAYSELARVELDLEKIPTSKKRLDYLVDHTFDRRSEVEPAWFEHAATEVK